MAEPAAAFDPFAAAGWTTPATNDNGTKPGYSAVVDVEQPYDPTAAPGTPGSETIRSLTGGPAAKDVPPPVAPGTAVAPTSDRAVTLGILNDTLNAAPGYATPAVTTPKEKPAAFDPFAAAGWTADKPGATAPAAIPGAPAIPSSVANQEVRAQPWYQGLHDTLFSPVGTFAGATKEAQHAFTLGLDEIVAPLVPAITDALTSGKPFSQAYDDAAKATRQPRAAFEAEHPTAATGISLAAGAPTAQITAPLFAASAPGAALATRALNAARNVGAGAGVGGATGFTMTDGDIGQRVEGARQGAELGGVLSAVAPTVAAAGSRLNTAVRPGAAIDRLAGGALRDAAALGPNDAVPVPTPSPLPNVPIGVAGGFNSPGLAATERLLNTTDNAGALAERTAQNTGVRDAATGSVPGLTRLADATPVPEAAAAMTEAMQGAHGVLRNEESRLWTTPSMQAVVPDIPAAATRVQRSIAALPARFQSAMTRNADVYNALQDFYNLPATASLHDMNTARSDILAAARSLPPAERFAKAAANTAADAILDAIESNPGLRTNPTALSDYRRARAFTRTLNAAFEQPQFQAMVNATAGNRKGLDPSVVGRGAFNLTRNSERTPGGISNIIGMLDDLRRTWGALSTANAGVALPGLHPSAAFGARAELAQGYRNLIVNSILDAAGSTERDLANNPNLIMNRLSQTIDRNRDWIEASGALNPSQMQVLDRIRDASVMAAKAQSLRGGRGSETFERLTGDRYLDVFLGPMLSRVLPRAGGAIGGAVTEHLAPGFGIGALIGLELAGAGHGTTTMLQNLYAIPRQQLRDRLSEAIRDPAIAADLMRHAGAKVSPATQQWARSMLAEAPTAQAARTLGPEQEAPQ